MAASLTQYSRRKWREQGYYVEGTETIMRLQGGLPRRSDLFGFADLIALKEGHMVLIQTTSWSNVSARVRKIQNELTGVGQWARPIRDIARTLLGFPGVSIVVEGWKKNPAGKYIDRTVPVYPEMVA